MEMNRSRRTLVAGIVGPVLSTSLYFVVFGTAIGDRVGPINGIGYGAFIIPGLIMLSIISRSMSNAAFGIFLPKWSGTIYEILSAPVTFAEVLIGYIGATALRTLLISAFILCTARVFVPYEIAHPVVMISFLSLTAVTFSLLGFVVGSLANDFQKLQLIPVMVVTPLTFLGGAFYSIDMLPPLWRQITLFNPVLYLIRGFRWSFYGGAESHLATSAAVVVAFFFVCLVSVWWIFKTRWRS
jgi:ABC-2 type transport system permease protein